MDVRPLAPGGVKAGLREARYGQLRQRTPCGLEGPVEPDTASSGNTQVPQLDFSAAFRHHVPPPPPPPIRLPDGVSNPFLHPNSFPRRRPASHRAARITPTFDVPAQRRPVTARPQRPTTAGADVRARSRASAMGGVAAWVVQQEAEPPTQRRLSGRNSVARPEDRETVISARPQTARPRLHEGESGGFPSDFKLSAKNRTEEPPASQQSSERSARWSTFLRDKRYTSRPISKVETSGSLVPPGVHPNVLQEHMGEAEMQIYRSLNREVVLSEEELHAQNEMEKLKDAIVNRKPMPFAPSNGIRPISPGEHLFYLSFSKCLIGLSKADMAALQSNGE